MKPTLLFIAVATALVAVLSACSPIDVNCSQLNCDGCCDLQGRCQRGNTVDACGAMGTTCNQCSSGQTCAQGMCSGVPTPDAGAPAADAGQPGTDAGTPSTDGGTPTCGCFDGASATCALRIQQYGSAHGCVVPAATGDTTDLFTCSNGAWTKTATCANGCAISPSGTVDTCSQHMNPGDAGTSCPGLNGAYCGQELGLSSTTLYECQNGAVSVKQQCSINGSPATCVVHSAGTPDNCPCPSGNGDYCGGDGLGLNPGNLYNCNNGVITLKQQCATGCQVNDAGRNDVCVGNCPGPGYFCGNDKLNLLSSDLYHCPGAGVAPDSVQGCPNGCNVQPSGTNDYCNAASCPNGINGLYCGNDGLGLNANTLYDCQNGTVTQVSACSGSCVIVSGKNDHCSTCPNGDGYYCGNDGLGLNANELYDCVGGVPSPSRDCTNLGGCVIASGGYNDYCKATACDSTTKSALSWEASQLNAGYPWANLCLGFVNNAFLNANDYLWELQAYTANEAMNDFINEGKLNGYNASQCPPCGAIVFWDANACNGYYGHIVISNGDCTVSTSGWGYNDPNGNFIVTFYGSTRASISWLNSVECGYQPAGWVAE